MEQPEQAEPRPEEAPHPIVPDVEQEAEKAEKAAEASDDSATVAPADES